MLRRVREIRGAPNGIVQSVYGILKSSYLDGEYASYGQDGWRIETITFIDNEELFKLYGEKRREFEHDGKDLSECVLFSCYRGDLHVPKIQVHGISTDIGTGASYLGSSDHGILLCRHADIQLKAAKLKKQDRCWMVFFLATCGKTMKVRLSPKGNKDVPLNADCHVCADLPRASEDLRCQAPKSQVYLCDFDPVTKSFLRRPRHCLPLLTVVFANPNIPMSPPRLFYCNVSKTLSDRTDVVDLTEDESNSNLHVPNADEMQSKFSGVMVNVACDMGHWITKTLVADLVQISSTSDDSDVSVAASGSAVSSQQSVVSSSVSPSQAIPVTLYERIPINQLLRRSRTTTSQRAEAMSGGTAVMAAEVQMTSSNANSSSLERHPSPLQQPSSMTYTSNSSSHIMPMGGINQPVTKVIPIQPLSRLVGTQVRTGFNSLQQMEQHLSQAQNARLIVSPAQRNMLTVRGSSSHPATSPGMLNRSGNYPERGRTEFDILHLSAVRAGIVPSTRQVSQYSSTFGGATHNLHQFRPSLHGSSAQVRGSNSSVLGGNSLPGSLSGFEGFRRSARPSVQIPRWQQQQNVSAYHPTNDGRAVQNPMQYQIQANQPTTGSTNQTTAVQLSGNNQTQNDSTVIYSILRDSSNYNTPTISTMNSLSVELSGTQIQIPDILPLQSISMQSQVTSSQASRSHQSTNMFQSHDMSEGARQALSDTNEMISCYQSAPDNCTSEFSGASQLDNVDGAMMMEHMMPIVIAPDGQAEDYDEDTAERTIQQQQPQRRIKIENVSASRSRIRDTIILDAEEPTVCDNATDSSVVTAVVTTSDSVTPDDGSELVIGNIVGAVSDVNTESVSQSLCSVEQTGNFMRDFRISDVISSSPMEEVESSGDLSASKDWAVVESPAPMSTETVQATSNKTQPEKSESLRKSNSGLSDQVVQSSAENQLACGKSSADGSVVAEHAVFRICVDGSVEVMMMPVSRNNESNGKSRQESSATVEFEDGLMNDYREKVLDIMQRMFNNFTERNAQGNSVEANGCHVAGCSDVGEPTKICPQTVEEPAQSSGDVSDNENCIYIDDDDDDDDDDNSSDEIFIVRTEMADPSAAEPASDNKLDLIKALDLAVGDEVSSEALSTNVSSVSLSEQNGSRGFRIKVGPSLFEEDAASLQPVVDWLPGKSMLIRDNLSEGNTTAATDNILLQESSKDSIAIVSSAESVNTSESVSSNTSASNTNIDSARRSDSTLDIPADTAMQVNEEERENLNLSSTVTTTSAELISTVCDEVPNTAVESELFKSVDSSMERTGGTDDDTGTISSTERIVGMDDVTGTSSSAERSVNTNDVTGNSSSTERTIGTIDITGTCSSTERTIGTIDITGTSSSTEHTIGTIDITRTSSSTERTVDTNDVTGTSSSAERTVDMNDVTGTSSMEVTVPDIEMSRDADDSDSSHRLIIACDLDGDSQCDSNNQSSSTVGNLDDLQMDAFEDVTKSNQSTPRKMLSGGRHDMGDGATERNASTNEQDNWPDVSPADHNNSETQNVTEMSGRLSASLTIDSITLNKADEAQSILQLQLDGVSCTKDGAQVRNCNRTPPFSDAINAENSINENNSEAQFESDSVDDFGRSDIGSVIDRVTDRVIGSVIRSFSNRVIGNVAVRVIGSVTDSASDRVTDSASDILTDSVTDRASGSVTGSSSDTVTDSASGSVTDSASGSVTDSASGSVTDSVTDSASDSGDRTVNDVITRAMLDFLQNVAQRKDKKISDIVVNTPCSELSVSAPSKVRNNTDQIELESSGLLKSSMLLESSGLPEGSGLLEVTHAVGEMKSGENMETNESRAERTESERSSNERNSAVILPQRLDSDENLIGAISCKASSDIEAARRTAALNRSPETNIYQQDVAEISETSALLYSDDMDTGITSKTSAELCDNDISSPTGSSNLCERESRNIINEAGSRAVTADQPMRESVYKVLLEQVTGCSTERQSSRRMMSNVGEPVDCGSESSIEQLTGHTDHIAHETPMESDNTEKECQYELGTADIHTDDNGMFVPSLVETESENQSLQSLSKLHTCSVTSDSLLGRNQGRIERSGRCSVEQDMNNSVQDENAEDSDEMLDVFDTSREDVMSQEKVKQVTNESASPEKNISDLERIDQVTYESGRDEINQDSNHCNRSISSLGLEEEERTNSFEECTNNECAEDACESDGFEQSANDSENNLLGEDTRDKVTGTLNKDLSQRGDMAEQDAEGENNINQDESTLDESDATQNASASDWEMRDQPHKNSESVIREQVDRDPLLFSDESTDRDDWLPDLDSESDSESVTTLENNSAGIGIQNSGSDCGNSNPASPIAENSSAKTVGLSFSDKNDSAGKQAYSLKACKIFKRKMRQLSNKITPVAKKLHMLNAERMCENVSDALENNASPSVESDGKDSPRTSSAINMCEYEAISNDSDDFDIRSNTLRSDTAIEAENNSQDLLNSKSCSFEVLPAVSYIPDTEPVSPMSIEDSSRTDAPSCSGDLFNTGGSVNSSDNGKAYMDVSLITVESCKTVLPQDEQSGLLPVSDGNGVEVSLESGCKPDDSHRNLFDSLPSSGESGKGIGPLSGKRNFPKSIGSFKIGPEVLKSLKKLKLPENLQTKRVAVSKHSAESTAMDEVRNDEVSFSQNIRVDNANIFDIVNNQSIADKVEGSNPNRKEVDSDLISVSNDLISVSNDNIATESAGFVSSDILVEESTSGVVEETSLVSAMDYKPRNISQQAKLLESGVSDEFEQCNANNPHGDASVSPPQSPYEIICSDSDQDEDNVVSSTDDFSREQSSVDGGYNDDSRTFGVASSVSAAAGSSLSENSIRATEGDQCNVENRKTPMNQIEGPTFSKSSHNVAEVCTRYSDESDVQCSKSSSGSKSDESDVTMSPSSDKTSHYGLDSCQSANNEYGQVQISVLGYIGAFNRLPFKMASEYKIQVHSFLRNIRNIVSEEKIFSENTGKLTESEKIEMLHSNNHPLISKELSVEDMIDEMTNEITEAEQILRGTDPENSESIRDRKRTLNVLEMTKNILCDKMNGLRQYHKSCNVFVVPEMFRLSSEFGKLISAEGQLLFLRNKTLPLDISQQLYSLRVAIEDYELQLEENQSKLKKIHLQRILGFLYMCRKDLLRSICCDSAKSLAEVERDFSSLVEKYSYLRNWLKGETPDMLTFLREQSEQLNRYLTAIKVLKPPSSTHPGGFWQVVSS